MDAIDLESGSEWQHRNERFSLGQECAHDLIVRNYQLIA